MADKSSSYKYLALIIAVSVTCIIVAFITPYKIWHLGIFTLPGGVVLFPLAYFFDDIVAEVYGYKLARQLIWIKLFCMLLFFSALSAIIALPSAANGTLQDAFNEVFSQNLRSFLGFSVGLLLSDFINTFAISKWKILTRGKYFWLRSIGAAALGEATFSIVGGFIIYAGVIPFSEYLKITASVWFIKMTYAVIVSYPGALIVAFLKKQEKLDIYDYSTNFNPFKLSTEYSEAEKARNPNQRIYEGDAGTTTNPPSSCPIQDNDFQQPLAEKKSPLILQSQHD